MFWTAVKDFAVEYFREMPHWEKFILMLVALAGAFLFPSPLHKFLTRNKNRKG